MVWANWLRDTLFLDNLFFLLFLGFIVVAETERWTLDTGLHVHCSEQSFLFEATKHFPRKATTLQQAGQTELER